MSARESKSGSSEKKPEPAIVHDEAGNLVHYGFLQDGVFHPFASERLGDHNERIQNAKDDD